MAPDHIARGTEYLLAGRSRAISRPTNASLAIQVEDPPRPRHAGRRRLRRVGDDRRQPHGSGGHPALRARARLGRDARNAARDLRAFAATPAPASSASTARRRTSSIRATSSSSPPSPTSKSRRRGTGSRASCSSTRTTASSRSASTKCPVRSGALDVAPAVQDLHRRRSRRRQGQEHRGGAPRARRRDGQAPSRCATTAPARKRPGTTIACSPICASIRDAVVAIDAPLTLPSCVRCELPACPGADVVHGADRSTWFRERENGARVAGKKPKYTPYTQRASEVLLHEEHKILPRETLGQGMGPLTARAAYLTRALGIDASAQREPDRGLPEGDADAAVRGAHGGTLQAIGRLAADAARHPERADRSALRARRVARARPRQRPQVRRDHLRVHGLSVEPRRVPRADRRDRARRRLDLVPREAGLARG